MPVTGPTREVRLCASDELAEGAVVSRWCNQVPVAAARSGGVLFAFGALCPHQQADLSTGFLEEDGITCSHHLWRFDLATGGCAMMPGVAIPTYAVTDRDGAIWVTIPESGA
jgi:nitrite reductase/ring-hydroxylating ferredoxin subunit